MTNLRRRLEAIGAKVFGLPYPSQPPDPLGNDQLIAIIERTGAHGRAVAG
jgi:hypothetical protein